MSPDLQAARIRADVVGVIDDRRRQPEHPVLDRAKQPGTACPGSIGLLGLVRRGDRHCISSQ